MCGIGGILRTDGEPIPEEWLDAIDARIAYRGPDGSGRFRDQVEFVDEQGENRVVEIALVHRRMAIIDLNDGAQPMVSERGRDESEGLVAVVFNGCIYNHRELRKELEARGHEFVTDHSDTEVLIHGWREWGEYLPEYLEGMYAYAIWDRTKRALAVSRDWCGRKPLYCAQTADDDIDLEPRSLMIFASSPPAVFDIDWTGPALRRDLGAYEKRALLERSYFTSLAPDQQWKRIAFAHGIAGLSQARDGKIARGRHDIEMLKAMIQPGLRPCSTDSINQSNTPSPPAPCPGVPEGEGGTSVEQLLDQAVARRLEADVPLGCFLSGGVDSSLIAHFAKQHKPDLMTFSVRMPDARYDESKYAEAIAKHIGTNHTTLEVSMNPADDLVHLIDILGQPFGDSSILPTYWVAKAAREHVKVALSGDGGDELFIGYERYLAAPILAKHHRLLARIPSAILRKAHPKSKIAKFARLGDMARDYPTLGIAAMESIFTQQQIKELLPLPHPSGVGSDFVGSDEGSIVDRSCNVDSALHGGSTPPQRGGLRAIAELRGFDLENYLPYDLLRKVDTASMAVALEVRCPFLDRDLARAALAMPIEELIPNGERKGLLRQIARKYLPKECVDREKMGFAIPIGEWFRTDFGGMKTLLLDHLGSTDPFGPIELNRKAVQRFIDEHMSGQADHSHRLFTLLTLSMWARNATKQTR